MKVYYSPPPRAPAPPPALHPASLTAGSLASVGPQHPGLGRAAAFPVGNRRPPAHPHVPSWLGRASKMGMWPAGRTHQTDILRAYLSGAPGGWQQKRRPSGEAWMGASGCLPPRWPPPLAAPGLPRPEHSSSLLGLGMCPGPGDLRKP